MVLCACGCGGKLIINKWTGKLSKFIKGHHSPLTKERKEKLMDGHKKKCGVGNKSSCWRGGWKYFCSMCGKKIAYKAKTCINCRDTKGANNPNYKGKGFPSCIKCGKQLSQRNSKSNLCLKCYSKNNIRERNASWKGGQGAIIEIKKCQCGCGEEIKIYVGGHKPKYINGHSNRGRKFSEKFREFQRKKAVGKWSGKNNPMYGKLPIKTLSHYKRVFYKEIYFRSSWEAEFAKFLDIINEPWQYEPKTFEMNDRTYTPDFYLPNRNLWIEIKGYWWKGYKEKFEAFLQKYPEEKIKLIMHKPPYAVEDLEI